MSELNKLENAPKSKLLGRLKAALSRQSTDSKQLEARDEKIKEIRQKGAERDSTERTLLTSVAATAAAGILTWGANAGIRSMANRWAWLKQREGYALGVPHVAISLAGCSTVLAMRPRGLASTESEIAYKTFEFLGVIGGAQIARAWGDQSRAKQAAIARALQAAADKQ